MIPVGSFAELGTDTLVGDKFVDITGRGRGLTPPNSELPYEEPTDIFKTLDFAEFEQRLREMETILNDIEAGRGRVGQLVTGRKFYDDLRRDWRRSSAGSAPPPAPPAVSDERCTPSASTADS